jgi:predicted nucleic acid-binding protein
VKKAADSSVTIAALLGDHPEHDGAAEVLARCEATITHVALETYSVLTRLPPPHRADATAAAAALQVRLASTYATLDASMYPKALGRLAGAGVSGGATYDGLIALTALEYELELLTRDRRAERTYRALGVPYQMVC